MKNLNSYEDTVKTIENLSWDSFDPNSLMVVSAFSALEFASTLRAGIRAEPALSAIAEGELATDNLVWEDYQKHGDHADFLWHFIRKHNLISKTNPKVIEAGARYLASIASLDTNTRVMSIVSREKELAGIFEKIIPVLDENNPVLAAFKYYLVRHTELDQGEGGHSSVLAHLPVTEKVDSFWKIRLEFYKQALF
jgi:hypothetical protein